MKARFLTVFLCLALALCALPISACSPADTSPTNYILGEEPLENYESGMGRPLSMDTESFLKYIISESYCIVRATYVKTETDPTSSYHCFHTFRFEENLRGEFDKSSLENELFVLDGEPGVENYVENKQYTLIMDKITSIYYEKDKYIASYIFIELDEKQNISNFYVRDQALSTKNNLVETFLNYADAETSYKAKRPVTGTEYINSDNLAEVVAFSPNIIRAKPTSQYGVLKDRDFFMCEVIETLKGPEFKKTEIITLPKTCEVGREYIFLIEVDTETLENEASRYATVTSKTQSVIPVEDKERVEIIMKELGK